jgi:glycosyltransferase involved in cell wall biosynthesis
LTSQEQLQETISFLGLIPSDEAPELFQQCDLFVLPSNTEPWGLVINEALSSGKPVLTPRWVGCVPDLVHDQVNGFVVADNAPATLAVSITQAIQKDQLREMGLKGREIIFANDWNSRGTLSGWNELLKRTLVETPVSAAQANISKSAAGGTRK